MSKRQLLMILGVWVMILCGPGFPNDLKRIFAIVTGALIIVVAYKIGPDRTASGSGSSDSQNLNYVEHRNE